ncbi:MAG TPA: DNA translocase FtsK 4TM domain-containing protein, partial [Terracidiphilus sp.]
MTGRVAACSPGSDGVPMIKPIQIALAPTRNRPLNMFLGLVLALVSLLFLLSLATYHATDPSLNTSTDPAMPVSIHNWIGPIGAWSSDLFLQALGFTAFFLPIWLGVIALGWMRSRYAGAAWLRGTGAFLSLFFVPAVFALLPWHWHWVHAVPVEGVIGRLIAGVLVAWLNIQGAWVVAGVLAAAGIYFALSINFGAILQSIEDRWIGLQSLHDRWRNWREDRAERRAEAEWAEDEQNNPGPAQRIFTGSPDNPEPMAEVRQPSRLAALFGRRGKNAELNPVDDIPA